MGKDEVYVVEKLIPYGNYPIMKIFESKSDAENWVDKMESKEDNYENYRVIEKELIRQ